MTLQTSTSLLDAYSLPVSAINDFFESKAVANKRRMEEAKQKIWAAIFGRFDNLSRGLSVVAKIIADTAKHRA